MNILMLSLGGGGGNILRSVKALFRRDLATTQESDPRYAERLRRAVVTRFLDTNEFSTADVPAEERLIIGAQTTRRLGSRHDPELARLALEESKTQVEELIGMHAVVIVIGTGGKGTGAGTIVPIAQMARRLKKLVIPIFVRPSFEWHEVEKRRYDHAVSIPQQLDAAGIRLIEILNDRGYSAADPQPQPVVWERMNRPIARGLRGLLYVLSDLSQVDPSDLSMLFAGHGRLRVGFAEIEPPPDGDPDEAQVLKAVDLCWENPYSLFSKPVGTSLICIQGQWSNLVDGRLKGGLASLATAGSGNATYNPLHAFAPAAPKPWGITALFAEHTGNHAPLEIEWPEMRAVRQVPLVAALPTRPVPLKSGVNGSSRRFPVLAVAHDAHGIGEEVEEPLLRSDPVPKAAAEAVSYATFWDFALALNRGELPAVAMAVEGADADLPIDATQARKLAGTVWFRSVFKSLSPQGRQRLLDVLLAGTRVPNQLVRQGRRTVRLNQLPFEELKQAATDVTVPETVRTDVQLLLAIGTLWGSDALTRVVFDPVEEAAIGSAFDLLLQPFR